MAFAFYFVHFSKVNVLVYIRLEMTFKLCLLLLNEAHALFWGSEW